MRDVNYNKGTYENWKEYVSKYGIAGISKKSSEWIIKYLGDLELGKNLGMGSRKGARSYIRLNSYRHKLLQWSKLIEARGFESLIDVDLDALHSIMIGFKETYAEASISSFGREFKAFWNWYMRVNRLQGIDIKNICHDLQTAPPKTRFVYVTKEQLDEIMPYLDYEEQLLTLFLFDTLTRPPKECLNLERKDSYLKNGDSWINIPDEIAKNGSGRTFNLLYSGDQIQKHIKENDLQEHDYLFMSIKKYKTVYLPKLKKIAEQLFGDKISHPKAQKKYSELSPYDLRHSGAIHLRILAQKNNSISLDAIRQRGGWKDFDMLNYYTEFIGLTGEIKKEALLVEEDKTSMEKDIQILKKAILQKDEDMNDLIQKKFEEQYNKHTSHLTPEYFEKKDIIKFPVKFKEEELKTSKPTKLQEIKTQ